MVLVLDPGATDGFPGFNRAPPSSMLLVIVVVAVVVIVVFVFVVIFAVAVCTWEEWSFGLVVVSFLSSVSASSDESHEWETFVEDRGAFWLP